MEATPICPGHGKTTRDMEKEAAILTTENHSNALIVVMIIIGRQRVIKRMVIPLVIQNTDLLNSNKAAIIALLQHMATSLLLIMSIALLPSKSFSPHAKFN